MSQLRFDNPKPEFRTRVDERLRNERLIWLVTVGPSGQPEPSPVWFVWQDEAFVVYSRAGTPRSRNLDANTRVALHFDGDTRGGDIVVFTGQAELASDLPAAHLNAAYVSKYSDDFRRIGVTPEQFSQAYPLALRIRPTRVRGH